jgi:hypothetical protein
MKRMKEIWKDIKGYDNQYQVGNHGNVRSKDRTLHFKDGRCCEYRGIQLTPTDNGNGYKIVGLGGRKNRKNQYVHRLVAAAFLDNPHGYEEVNHKNEDKSNNSADNLEWCERKYNVNYGTGRERQAKIMKQKYKSGEMVGYYKGKHLLPETIEKIRKKRIERANKVLCIDTGEIFCSAIEAGKRYNTHPSNISHVCQGKGKTAKGLRFRYINQNDKETAEKFMNKYVACSMCGEFNFYCMTKRCIQKMDVQERQAWNHEDAV